MLLLAQRFFMLGDEESVRGTHLFALLRASPKFRVLTVESRFKIGETFGECFGEEVQILDQDAVVFSEDSGLC